MKLTLLKLLVLGIILTATVEIVHAKMIISPDIYKTTNPEENTIFGS